jgi:hypothetical protein
MEKRYEITEKQLAFLNDFLFRKYPSISDDIRIELTDHLISDFEVTTENGNLSQYLSNELEFIRNFVGARINLIQKNYNREVRLKYLSFFTKIKLLPFTILGFILIYVLVSKLNNNLLWLSFFFSVFGIYGYSLLITTFKSKKIRKLEEIKLLGTGFGMGIPYLMVIFPLLIENKKFLYDNTLFFTSYWFFALSLSIASILVLKEKKKIILEKYKHLLN